MQDTQTQNDADSISLKINNNIGAYQAAVHKSDGLSGIKPRHALMPDEQRQ